MELLQAAVQAAPAVAEIRFHLAQGWLKTGESARARSELERLLGTPNPFRGREEAVALLADLRRQTQGDSGKRTESK